MKLSPARNPQGSQGFSLIEMLVAVLITTVVMAAVFALLYKGQESFDREPEIAAMNQAARMGLQRIGVDLTMAGNRTPPAISIFWQDGGGANPANPDQITIVYADPNYPTALPECAVPNYGSLLRRSFEERRFADVWGGTGINRGEVIEAAMFGIPGAGAGQGGGGQGGGGNGGGGNTCNGGGTIQNSSTIFLDSSTLDPGLANPEDAYDDGMILIAFELGDCNNDGLVGYVPFELTGSPGNAGQGRLRLNHNPGAGTSGINPPGGFNGAVDEDCAIVGVFRMVEYRVNQTVPATPTLERRDVTTGDPTWFPVAANIENLQIQYASGATTNYADTPVLVPTSADANSWITGVQMTITGRTQTRDLAGSSAGVFAADDTYVRRSFSSVSTLRNQIGALQNADMTLMN